ncbi:hypothetical protein, partial [Staphylococcus aureus]|uniref:hypothetical protein n=1 Tax=Staphylococcus aureus TaxID=1280 RepID=UPI001C8360F2
QQMVKDGVLASTENCNKNLKQQDSKGIHYYSWTGVAQATNALDIDTILMQLGPLSYDNKDNDGMVYVVARSWVKSSMTSTRPDLIPLMPPWHSKW